MSTGYTVYLIHFHSKVSDRAQHYLGITKNLPQRIAEHRAGRGARLLEVCKERGIDISVVRIWRNRYWPFERALKAKKHASRMCPICNPKLGKRYVNRMRKLEGL